MSAPAFNTDVSGSSASYAFRGYLDFGYSQTFHAAQRSNEVLRADVPAQHLDSDAERWAAFQDRLVFGARQGTITPEQLLTFRKLWSMATSEVPALRYPAVGLSDEAEGTLQLSWSFVDLPQRAFVVEIPRNGLIEWFYRDGRMNLVDGTKDERIAELPPNALAHLSAFTR